MINDLFMIYLFLFNICLLIYLINLYLINSMCLINLIISIYLIYNLLTYNSMLFFNQHKMKPFDYYFEKICSNDKFSMFKSIDFMRDKLLDQYKYIHDNVDILTYDDYLNVDCINCPDCVMCIHCSSCTNCISCEDCFKCINSKDCLLCKRCSNCYGCNQCFMCHYDSYNKNKNGLWEIIFGIVVCILFILFIWFLSWIMKNMF